MGSDKSQKAKTGRELERKGASRTPKKLVLIVCEDSVSSPRYFEAVCRCLKLHYVHVKKPKAGNNSPVREVGILGSKDGDGTDPKSVVECAQKHEESYDDIYCVIDRDTHDSFHEAITMAGKSKKIKMIVSIPCFEYWLLLHFEYTSKPFIGVGNASCCDVLIKELKKHIPSYEKGNFFSLDNYINILKSNEKKAIDHAKRRVEEIGEVEDIYAENPYTNVYELILALGEIKEDKSKPETVEK